MKYSTPLACALIALPLIVASCFDTDGENKCDDFVGACVQDSGLITTPDAGNGGVAAGTGGVAAGTGGSAAGTGGSAAGTGGAQDGGGVVGGDGGSPTPPDGGAAEAGGGVMGGVGNLDPILPEISGECPAFKAGSNTVTVMGIRGTVIAGEKKECPCFTGI